MSVRDRRAYCRYIRSAPVLMLSAGFAASIGLGATAGAQTQLPEVVVSAPKQKPKPKKQAHVTPGPPLTITPQQQLNAKADAFDSSRANLYTTIGTTSDTQTHATIDALPGDNVQFMGGGQVGANYQFFGVRFPAYDPTAMGAPTDDIMEGFERKHRIKCKRCQEYGAEWRRRRRRGHVRLAS